MIVRKRWDRARLLTYLGYHCLVSWFEDKPDEIYFNQKIELDPEKSKILKNMNSRSGTEVDLSWWRTEDANYLARDGVEVFYTYVTIYEEIK